MKRKLKIEKSEWKYLAVSLVIIFGLVFVINNTITYTFISGLNPILQFLIMNVSLFLIFFLIAKFISKKKGRMVWQGATGAILSFLALDLIMPEYHVSCSGLTIGGIFGGSSSDYFFGYLFQNIGVGGCALPILTYGMFVILFIAGSLIMKDFYKKVTPED